MKIRLKAKQCVTLINFFAFREEDLLLVLLKLHKKEVNLRVNLDSKLDFDNLCKVSTKNVTRLLGISGEFHKSCQRKLC